MMSSVVWVYYVVVLTLSGSENITVENFKTFEQCERYMHANHKKLSKEYFIQSERRMTGSGCRREVHGY